MQRNWSRVVRLSATLVVAGADVDDARKLTPWRRHDLAEMAGEVPGYLLTEVDQGLRRVLDL